MSEHTAGLMPVDFCKRCGARGGAHYGACRGDDASEAVILFAKELEADHVRVAQEDARDAACTDCEELRELLREGAHHLYRMSGKESVDAYEQWRQRVRQAGIDA